MPGALPVRRMRREAPRPSVARANAVNSIVAMLATPWSGRSAAFRNGYRSSANGRVRVACPRGGEACDFSRKASAAMSPRRGPAVPRVQRIAFVDVGRRGQPIEHLPNLAVHDRNARLVVYVAPIVPRKFGVRPGHARRRDQALDLRANGGGIVVRG